MSDTYKCTVCKETFEFVLSEQEAEDQLAKEFPGVDKADCNIVCEDCYNRMFA